MSTARRFLSKLETAEKVAGISLFRGFLSTDEAQRSFDELNDDSDFPWNLKPRLYGEKLSQHAYQYDRLKKNKKEGSFEGLSHLESICQKIEQEFDVDVKGVYCNRFQDPTHHIPYHTDKFGLHIMVLSLGSERVVQFRNKKTKEVDTVQPSAGDLYFMPLGVNKTHEHCVCEAQDKNAGTRLSFVFFLETPSYAEEYKISTGDKIRGFFEGIFAG